MSYANALIPTASCYTQCISHNSKFHKITYVYMVLIFLFDFFNIDHSEFTIGKAKYNLGDFHAFEEKYLLMENVFVDLVWMWHLYSTANVRWFSMDYHRVLLKVNSPQNNNIELTRITRRLFDFKNRWNVSLSPQSRIDVTSKFAVWRKSCSWFDFVLL